MKRPLDPAPSRDPCFWCGEPGFRGCEHWAPFEPPVIFAAPKDAPRACFNGRREFSPRAESAKALRVEVDDFLRRTGAASSSFGRAAAGNGGFVAELRRGAIPRQETIDAVRAYLAERSGA